MTFTASTTPWQWCEQFMDTRKLEAARPTVAVLEAIVEEDRKRLVRAQLDYERAQAGPPSAVSASPPSSSVRSWIALD